MLTKCMSLLRAPARAPGLPVVPARRWNQCTLFLTLPPRHPHSLGESLMHSAFMMVVWIAPLLALMTQVKVWRRKYGAN